MDFLASGSIDLPHIPARDSAENRSIGSVDCDTGPNLCKHSGKRKGVLFNTELIPWVNKLSNVLGSPQNTAASYFIDIPLAGATILQGEVSLQFG